MLHPNLNPNPNLGPEDKPVLNFNDGETILLQPTEASPFIAEIPRGESYQSFDNNLYKVFRSFLKLKSCIHEDNITLGPDLQSCPS